jgi:methylmalonyl-CoA/ethylmalonyl-CoA epimerase
MAVRRIAHVAIAVPDIERALAFWRDALGLELAHTEEVQEQESVVAFLPTGESEVELVQPSTETGAVARHLGKRGPGMHHICLEVDNIEETLARLKAGGVRLINPEPTIGAGGKKIAFIHPASTGGVLIELSE